jgi:hypothetical protein
MAVPKPMRDLKIFLIVSVDTECDAGPGWVLQWPLRFSSVLEGIPSRLEPLLNASGARASYLISPEVMRDPACVEVLRAAERDGAGLGAHLHGEMIEPDAIEDVAGIRPMQNVYPRDVEREKILNLTRMFEEAFGRRPSSFRAGRFGLGPNTLPILAELGYAVDSSVAPYSVWRDQGGSVEFFGAPIRPYFPSAEDPKKEGSLPILEVPLTIGRTIYERLPQRLVEGVASHPRFWGTVRRISPRRFDPIWLRPTFRRCTFEAMRALVLGRIEEARGESVFLVMMFHSVEVVAGCSPYAQNESEVGEFAGRLSRILDLIRNLGAVSITLDEVPSFFRVGEGLA